jgi:hypothetical protein
MQGGTAVFQSQWIFFRKRQESGGKRLYWPLTPSPPMTAVHTPMQGMNRNRRTTSLTLFVTGIAE